MAAWTQAAAATGVELTCGCPFEAKFENWACMHAEGDNLGVHDHYYQDHGGEGGATFAATKKGPWTGEEDEKLEKCVVEHGVGNWITIERYSGLGRTSKSCRLRWTNHLRPNLKKGSFTREEERLVVKLHQMYGNKWSYIASKLPGRTDNEVKNFWHGRVRRCHKKFLPIYPDDIQNDGSCRNGLVNNDGKIHLNDEDHSSYCKGDTESILLFPSITFDEFESTYAPFQEQPSPVINQKPPLAFNPMHRTQLISPRNQELDSPADGLSSSDFPSPACCTTQILPSPPVHKPSQSHYTSMQENCSSPQQSFSNAAATSMPLRPPPVLCPLVGKFKRSLTTCTMLSSPPTVTHFSAPELDSPISAPGSSVNSLKTNVSWPVPPSTSQLLSPKLHLSAQLAAASSEQLHAFSMPSDLSSTNQSSRSLNDKTTEQTPHSLLSTNLTNSMQPDLYSQPSQSARPSLLYPPTWDSLISEPPSVQTPTSAFRPIPEMKINHLGTDAEILDAPTNEANANVDISYQKSLEEKLVDGGLPNNDLVQKKLENETFKKNVFHPSSRKRKEILNQSFKREHTETKISKIRDLVNQSLSRTGLLDECFKSENLMSEIRRRGGQLSEISKTGVLPIERGKKQILPQGLLEESLTQDVLTSKRPNTEDMQSGDISKIRKLIGESLCVEAPLNETHKRKHSVDQKSDESMSICDNFPSLRNQNLDQNLMCYNQLASQGQGHNFKALDHCTEVAFQKYGDEREKLSCRDELKAHGQCTTIYPFGLENRDSIWHSAQPSGIDLFGTDPTRQGSSGRRLTHEVSPYESSRGSFPVESSSERMTALHNLTSNEFVSPAHESSTAQLLKADSQGGDQYHEDVKREMEGVNNTMPEEFSTLVEYFLTDIPYWNDKGCETSGISDMTFGI